MVAAPVVTNRYATRRKGRPFARLIRDRDDLFNRSNLPRKFQKFDLASIAAQKKVAERSWKRTGQARLNGFNCR
jgi:hypothetical protein